MIETYTSSRKAVGACFVSLLLLFFGCGKRTRSSPNSETTAPPTAAKVDACALITHDEIREIQESPIKETKSSANTNRGFRVAQCFYTANEFSKSVSLTVTERDPEHPTERTPKGYWKQVSSNPAEENKREDEEREQERVNEREERSAAPKKIDGVGDEAYWNGNRMGGALYVLKKDVYIRISIGGSDNEETKINKLKALERL